MSDRKTIEELIARVALKDRAAFAELYGATSSKLFGVALRVLGNQTQAEDAIQDVYIKIWHKADQYQVNGLSPMTWLITLTRNQAIDVLRKRRESASLDTAMELPDLSPGPETMAAQSQDRRRIVICLGGLEPKKAEAVQRAYILGETYQELATRFNVPLNTMRTWLRRSLANLKECLST